MIHDDPTQQTSIPVLTISAITALLKEVVEGTFPSVWVSGEISNFTAAGSGHCYLTLKDDSAQLKAVICCGVASKLKFRPEDGLSVIVRGHLDVYAARGTYQIVIEEIHPRGIGAAELALRRLQQKLSAEGLFDPAHKKPLPEFPRRIGIVTSPTGAAVKDFLEVLRRRWQGASVLVIPTRVQGDGVGKEIAAAVKLANAIEPPLDVLVVARGGGSSEDLSAFNEESVVRAIFASEVPVVSAVGHEIDVTLCDLVADVRAATPSEAAERVVPAARELLTQVQSYRERLSAALTWRVQNARQRVEQIANRPPFRKPFDFLLDLSQWLDEWQSRTSVAVRHKLAISHQQIAARAAQLEALQPASGSFAGYSVTTRATDQRVLSSAADVTVGEQIVTRLVNGQIQSRVEKIEAV